METQLYYNVERTNFIGEEPEEITGVAPSWNVRIPGGGTQPPVADRAKVYVTSGKGRVHAINGRTGDGEWRSAPLGSKTDPDSREVLTPYLDRSNLFVTVLETENYEVSGTLAIVSDQDGEVAQTYTDQNYTTEAIVAPELSKYAFLGTDKWVTAIEALNADFQLDLNHGPDPTDTEYGFPVYADLTIPAKTADEKIHLTATDSYIFAPADDCLFIYDTAQEESEVVEFGRDAASISTVMRCVTVSNGTAYVPVHHIVDDEGVDEIIAYEYAGGVGRWQTEIPAQLTGPIATNGEFLYLPTKESIIALDADDGTKSWEYEVKSYLPSDAATQPAVTDQTVFAHYHSEKEDFGLIALDAATGTEKWRFEYAHDSPPVTYPVIGGPGFIYRTEAGTVHALELLFDEEDAEEAATSTADETETDPSDGPSSRSQTEAVQEVSQDKPSCPSCGTQYEPDSNFCSNCGTELPQTQCPECESDVDPDDSFCANCGTALD